MLSEAQHEILIAICADWSLADTPPLSLRHRLERPRVVAATDVHVLYEAGFVFLRDRQWWPTAEGRIAAQQREGGR